MEQDSFDSDFGKSEEEQENENPEQKAIRLKKEAEESGNEDKLL